jgi:hypothetical protein
MSRGWGRGGPEVEGSRPGPYKWIQWQLAAAVLVTYVTAFGDVCNCP